MILNPAGRVAWPGGSAVQTRTSADLGQNPTHLLLDGSVTPIELSGTVFVNGDVVLRGLVRGHGTLLARGNLYVMGDLTYDCGTGNTPIPCDYSNPSRLPQLNLIAGGNLLVGDFMSVQSDIESLTEEQMLSTRSNQPTIGFCRENPSDAACYPEERPRPNLALTEIANFNRRELQHYLRDNTYRPRLYTFAEDRIYFATGCSHQPQRYGEYSTIAAGARVSFCRGDTELSSTTLTAEQARSILARAARYEVTSSIFNNAVLKNLWASSMNARGVGPLRTDGLLYSANAIFGLAQRKYTKLGGRWDLRGALVAADTGILVPGPGDGSSGLTIYHDSRLRPRVPGGQQAQLRRGIWEVVGQ